MSKNISKFVIPALAAILAGGAKAIDEAMAPLRARKARASAETILVGIDEQRVSLERKIVELCVKDTIDFNAVLEAQNEYELLGRRKDQLEAVVAQLFPTNGEALTGTAATTVK